MMRNYDLSPLYRATVGFDRLFKMLDGVNTETRTSYPPYNIERTDENTYRISIAVAGFSEDELDIEVVADHLTVSGAKQEGKSEKSFLHHGIAERNFTQRFELADTVKVATASLQNGLLNVDLVREIPESQKPCKVQIASGAAKVIDAKAA